MMKTKEDIIRKSKSGEDGFTLLEVLVALALVSLVTIAIFQSFMSMTRLSDRAQRTTEATFNEHIDRVLLERVVEGLFAERATKGRNNFKGTADQFSGMSNGLILPEQRNRGLLFVKVSIIDGAVVLMGADQELTFSSKVKARSFSYLGTDRAWHADWPPESALTFGPADKVKNLDHQLVSPPLIPLAVRINFVDGSDWIALSRGTNRLTAVVDDI